MNQSQTDAQLTQGARVVPFVKLWGTRGSIPRSGADSVVFGGATTCYELRYGTSVVIMDAGSGIVPLGQQLMSETVRDVSLVFSHFHYDHVIGLPFFGPLFDPSFTIHIYAAHDTFGNSAENTIRKLFAEPFFPVSFDVVRANIQFHNLSDSPTAEIAPGIEAMHMPLSHPGGNTALKLKVGSRSVVYSGDFVHGDVDADSRLTAWLRNADLGILECTYTPELFERFPDFGHTHWKAVGEMAKKAKSWVGVHHNHLCTDDDLQAVDKQLKTEFPNGCLGRDGMKIPL